MTTEPKRVHNFNAGPAGLPLEVLQQAQAELLDFKGTGMSRSTRSALKEYNRSYIQAIVLYSPNRARD